MSKKKSKKNRKARRGKKYRKVYPYKCTGCAKNRIAFNHDRAKAELCSNCEVMLEYMRTQPTLF